MQKFVSSTSYSSMLILFISFFGLSAVGAGIKLDDFESGASKNWRRWPKSGIIFKTISPGKSGKKAGLMDMREQAGAISRLIPTDYVKGTRPYGLKLKLKAGNGNQRPSFNLTVRESKGKEKYYQTISIPQTWQQLEIKFEDLKLFPYGNAKILDRKLDVTDIGEIRFESYPKGAVILVDDLTLLTGKAVKQTSAAPAAKVQININEIKLPETGPDYAQNYAPHVQNVRVKGSNFIRNGKATFLLGGWQADNEGSPWLFRALGVDVYPYNATEIYTLYPPKKNGNTYTLTWKANPWYEAMIHRALKNKVMFWHEHKGDARVSVLKKVPGMKEVIDAGHYVGYDPFNTLGLRFYDEMFKSWMRHTRKYPVFCYELFNEMVYYNDKKITRDAFKNEMRHNYENIDKANKVWGTRFKSFAAVQPPGFIASNAMSTGVIREKLKQQEARKYPNLWLDWLKFQEKTCAAAVAYLMKTMRAHDPAPSKLSTLQSHCQLFFDYGDSGITPETIDKNVDFYSHEMNQVFYLSNHNENITNIKKMLKTPLSNDLVRGVCNKPIFNAESPLSVSRQLADKVDLLKKDLVGLHGKWKFADGTESRPENWAQPSFDDQTWNSIEVPGMWGKQGFTKCQKGLYRKQFKRPNVAADTRFYLNGKAFADRSKIYLNGKEVGRTKGFNTAFSIDLTDHMQEDNVLAVEVVNTYFRDNMYFGGIRGYASINSFPAMLAQKRSPEPKHYRTHLWSQIAHGMGGVMVCYDNNFYCNSVKILPKVKKEIETVSDIVLKRPAAISQLAVVYPKETLRGVLHNGYIQKISAPATLDLLNAYGPALFSGLGTDVIQNSDICGGKVGNYKMIIMAGNKRGQDGEVKKLAEYVKTGGILIADVGCLQINDNSHQKVSTDALFGIKVLESSTQPKTIPASDILGNKVVICEKRFSDQLTVETIQATTAKTLVKFNDGTPAVTVRQLGKGKAYYIAANLPFTAYSHLLSYITQANNLKPEVELDATRSGQLFVESKVFKSAGRYVLFLLNWGKNQQVAVKLPTLPAGTYRIRNLATGNTLNCGKQSSWSNQSLLKGIPMPLNSLDTVALLIESNAVSPLVIKGISPTRHQLLDQLWTLPAGNAQNSKTVAFTPIRTMTDNFGETPTAKRLLNLNGYKTVNYTDKCNPDDIDVLIWYHGRRKMKQPQKIIDFVKNGGGLLLTGTGIKNYHDSLHGFKQIFSKLGLNQAWMRYLYTDKPANGDDMLNVSCKVANDHPVTRYVKQFIASSAGIINAKPDSCTILLTADNNSSKPGAKVMIAKTLGKGRIVYISDFWWLRPFNINKADNAQLFLNTINWLAGKQPVKLTDNMKEQALFISADILEQAEAEESAGQKTLAPFSQKQSSLDNSGSSLSGTAGGDPIVDILQ